MEKSTGLSWRAGCPSGMVYFVYDKPLVQVHFFGREYTLFWLGSITAESFLADALAIFQETLLQGFPRPSLLFPFRYRPLVEGTGSVH